MNECWFIILYTFISNIYLFHILTSFLLLISFPKLGFLKKKENAKKKKRNSQHVLLSNKVTRDLWNVIFRKAIFFFLTFDKTYLPPNNSSFIPLYQLAKPNTTSNI